MAPKEKTKSDKHTGELDRLSGQTKGRGRRVECDATGLLLYVIDQSLKSGFYGNSEQEVVSRLLGEAARQAFDRGRDLGQLSLEDAEAKGYIPIGFRYRTKK